MPAASGNPRRPRPLPSPSSEEEGSTESEEEASESKSSPESRDPHFQPVRSLDKPLASSSSSYTSDEEEGEEEEKKEDSESSDSEPSLKEDGARPPPSKFSDKVLPLSPYRQSKLPASPSSGEEESESSSDSEPSRKEDGARLPPSKSSDRAIPPPPPGQSKLPASPSSGEEESESSEPESSSEEDGPISQPAKSSLPILNSGASPSSPDKGDPEIPSSSSDARLAPKEPLPPQPVTSSGPIQRLWTKDDEMTLLEKLLEYKDQRGRLPSMGKEVDVFHKSVQHLFSANISAKQLIHKMRNLRKRFNNYNKKLKSGGKAPDVGEDHLLLVLLRKLWKKTEDGLGNEVMENRSAKRMKTSKEPKDVIPNPYKFLTMVVEHMDDKLKGAGKRPWLKDHLLLLDTKTQADLDMKCFKYFLNESQVSASRLEFRLRLIEATQEEEGIIVHPSPSYFHSGF